MFDWDRDFDDVVRHKSIRVHAEASTEEQPRPWYWQSLVSRVALPLVAATGIMVAAFMGNQWVGSATATTQISSAIFGGMMGESRPAAVMPDNLQAYDREGFERFMQRMAAISDTDLVQYSQATQRDLGDGTGVMAPYQADVLVLTRLEMTRRGLIQQPVQTARLVQPAPAQASDAATASRILQITAPLIREN